jgi:hypothetical protein
MSIVTMAQALAQCRLEDDYPPEQLQPYIDGAEDAAAAYLNRQVYVDQVTLDQATTAAPAALGAANMLYTNALAAAADIADLVERQATIDVANARLAAAKQAFARTINGIVANSSVLAAVLLIIGQLFENRSNVIVGAPAMELPCGAESLLRPYRRVMMP